MRRAVVLRRVGLWVLGTVAAVLALVVVALAVLRTDWGGDLVRKLAVPRINQAIAGKLELGGFRYRGSKIELSGVTLRDPEGERVLHVRRIFVAFSPTALLRNHVDVREVRLEQPDLVLERTRNGLNLARAIAPRRPDAPPAPARDPSDEPSSLKLSVRRLELVGGAVRFRDAGAGAPPPIHLAQLDGDGAVELAMGTGAVDARLKLEGRGITPIRAPLSLMVDARAVGGKGGGNLSLALEDTRVALAGQGSGRPARGHRRQADPGDARGGPGLRARLPRRSPPSTSPAPPACAGRTSAAIWPSPPPARGRSWRPRPICSGNTFASCGSRPGRSTWRRW